MLLCKAVEVVVDKFLGNTCIYVVITCAVHVAISIRVDDERMKANPRAVRVTADFGASCFIAYGSRFVTLIFFLKYYDVETVD